ncbi:50S ribosomal protein L13 [bacterium]|nr:50S ribosomal protein L13 [bacterium]
MERATHKIDATGKIAGRLASEIAVLLQGKNKISYQPHTDCGDIVEVSNIAEMKFSGKKLDTKVYHRYTGYPGGIRTKKLSDMMEKEPQEVLRKTIYNMLPKNRLRSNMIKRLKIS